MDSEKVILIYQWRNFHDVQVVKVMKDINKAVMYCDEQNEINKPEFDDYGYYQGIFHTFEEFEVE